MIGKQTIKHRFLFWFGLVLQGFAVFSLLLILVVVLVIPPPDLSAPPELQERYQEVVSYMDPLDGLLWVGVFFLGIKLRKTGAPKKQNDQ